MLITWQDYEKATDKTQWIRQSISKYINSEEYKKAKTEEAYMAGNNVTITQTIKTLYDLSGRQVTDTTAANNRIATNIAHRLVSQRCAYSLGNGVFFANAKQILGKDGKTITIDQTKDILGDKFDNMVFRSAYWACANGESYTYVHRNYDQEKWEFEVFKKSQFIALYDEYTGKLRGGIRFWSLNFQKKPISAVFYSEDGYQQYETAQGEIGLSTLHAVSEIIPYTEIIEENEVDGVVVVGSGDYTDIPIIPLYANETHVSILDNLRSKIDAIDLTFSGFANDMEDVAQIFWLVSGAMGATDEELTQMRDRAKLLHVLNIDSEHSSITPFREEPPYNARATFLEHMINRVYSDFGALDVTNITARARTATEINAAYEPMDEEADAFEYQLIEYIQNILRVVGRDDMPLFMRKQIHNQKEITEMVMSAADILDPETIINHLPFISVDEREEILARLDAQNLTGMRTTEQLKEELKDEAEDQQDNESDSGEDQQDL